MELFSIQKMPKEAKILLLKELGYDSDGRFVLKNGEKVKDIYVDVDITLSNMLIFPGSTILLDNNPLSIALYMDDFTHLEN
ncbi:MAG: hypothetical protein ABH821_01695 [archaeon]